MSNQLEKNAIADMPRSMYYIPDFISEGEESCIMDHIPASRWIALSHRRLQAVPAKLTTTNTLLSSTDLPKWLAEPILSRLTELGIFVDSPHGAPNHCLVNEYLPGQGILPHEDGAAYYPVVATVSLGGTIVLDVAEKQCRDESDSTTSTHRKWRVLQEPRSLLVTTESAYVDTLHGIAEVTEDLGLSAESVANWSLLGDRDVIVTQGGKNHRTTRISLTFRDVLKVASIGKTLFGRPKE